ncbi:MAG: hypothetical protein QXP36_14265 [Conexivisphaerales archaeon]
MVQLDNFAGYSLTNVVVDVYTANGSIHNVYNLINQYANGMTVNPPSDGNGLAIFDNVYVVGYGNGIVLSFGSNLVRHVHIKKIFIQYCYYGLYIGNAGNYPPIIGFADIEQCPYPVVFNNPNPIWLPKAHFQLQSQGAWSSIGWNNAIQYFTSIGSVNVYGEIEMYITGGSPADNPLLGRNTQYLSTLIFHQVLGYGAIAQYPMTSMGQITNGPTAGTVQQIIQSYSAVKKSISFSTVMKMIQLQVRLYHF